MTEKEYGDKKLLYKVAKRQDGWIDLLVCHDNAEMRKKLKKHINNTSSLLQHYEAYLRSNIRAQYHLAIVMADYRSYFEKNLVEIVL
jgi:hypothetical protein